MTFKIGRWPPGKVLDIYVRGVITPAPPRPNPETVAKVQAFIKPKIDVLAWRKR